MARWGLVDDTTGTDDGGAGAGADADGGPGAPIEQFQRAALDAVQAARAFLDAAERMIEEPAALEAVVDTVNAVVRQASGVVADFAGRAREQPPDPDDGSSSGYESIRID